MATKSKKSGSETLEKELKKLGKRITALRKKNGYKNHEKFAFQHDIGRSQYWRYEQGADMRFSSILKVIAAHGMTLKEFFSEGFE